MMKYFVTIISLILLGMTGCTSVPVAEQVGASYGKGDVIKSKEIVFIHGMFVTPKCWQSWEDYFKKLGYQVSAPAWPLHEGTVEELRQPQRLEALGQLELAHVLDHYRKILKTKSAKPILIGHSMGGLVAQILLHEGLAEAAIAIDSAPPDGLIVLKWSFIKSNWGVVSPFASKDKPIELDADQFAYSFLNQQPESEQEKIYQQSYVPESRRVGKGPTTDVAEIDEKKARGPLLIIAGEEDHIIPAKLNYKNFDLYKESPSYTEFKMFLGRDHWIISDNRWTEVAEFVQQWLAGH